MNEVGKDRLATPTNKGVNRFQPRHTQNDGVDADWGDVECLTMGNAGDGELESDFAGDVGKNSAICQLDFDRGTRFSDKAKSIY